MSKPAGRGAGPKTAPQTGGPRPGGVQKAGVQRPAQKVAGKPTAAQAQQAQKAQVANRNLHQNQHIPKAQVANNNLSPQSGPSARPLQQQQQQQQQQPPRKTPLEVLQDMLNFILVFTGRILANPTRLTPETIGQSNNQLRQTTSVVVSKSHMALDEIESEIFRAQIVLRRDLAALRSEKARQKAAEEEQREKDRMAAEEASRKAEADKAKGQATTDTNSTATTNDVDMLDVHISTSVGPNPVNTDTMTKTPTTAHSFDFGSIFGDNASTQGERGASGDMDLDLDIDMGLTTTTTLPDKTSSTNSVDAHNKGLPNEPPQKPTTSSPEAVQPERAISLGLLPGLESYANNPDPAAAPTSTSTSMAPSMSQQLGPDLAGGSGDADTMDDQFAGGAGSSFDELFTFDGGADGGDWGGGDDPFKDL